MDTPHLWAIASSEPSNVEATEFESCSYAEAYAELQRILNSPHFEASDRNRRFLEYVVEETLAGRGERIKAYCIATTVFGRDDSFDPQLDPVVRMEAGRLRRSLERFYLVAGEGASVHITVPKGSYKVSFLKVGTGIRAVKFNPKNLVRETTSPRPAVSVFVSPFQVEDDWRTYENHGSALSRHITIGLSHFPGIGVFAPRMDFERIESGGVGFSIAARDVGFTLSGNAALARNAFRVAVTLANARCGRVIWGERFEEDIPEQGLLQARELVANRIVRALIELFDERFRDVEES